jgi:hypothetical protein
MLTKTSYGLRSSLDELDTLLDVLLEAESSRNIHELRAVVGVSDQKLKPKNSTYSGRQALRSSSSSADKVPTGWILVTPSGYEREFSRQPPCQLDRDLDRCN